jgi:biopolymer transport protein ExbD
VVTRAAALAEINVTPLVDILLVLLIIFMLVVPLAPRALDTSLPPTAPPAERDDPVPLVLAIDDSGLALNREPLGSLDALGERLADLFATCSDRTLFVRADGRVRYGVVVAALDTARGAGAERIGIMGGSR